jgi:3-oxoacyl-[acyl-carrier protein] reductase
VSSVALITGGGTGIGRAVALALASRGWSVAINYSRSEQDARAVAAEIELLGAQALVVRGDVASDDDCKDVVRATVERWQRIDALVNSAGTTAFVPAAELDAITVEAWDRIFAVNVRGAFQMARAAASTLRAARGNIVNISSTAGETAVGSSIPYAASKAALDNITKSLARTLAPAVRVNGVAPGFVDTRWLVEGYGDRLDAIRKLVKQQTPLRDVARPEQVAQVVVALLTSMDWVTGETIAVDGGYTIRG